MAEAALAGGTSGGLQVGVHEELVETLNRRLVRMALDVHDGPMQELVAAGYALSVLRQRLDGGASDDAASITATVDEICNRLVMVEQGLRSVIFSLEQSAESRPLRAAVEDVVAAARAETPARIELTFVGEVEAATDSQRIALSRVVRESLANAIRHGAPDRIQVRLSGNDDMLLLQVTDDGCGFAPATIASTRGDGRQVGIAGMEERLRLLGGRLTIESRPGGPTTISALVEKWQPPEGQSSGGPGERAPRMILVRGTLKGSPPQPVTAAGNRV